MLIELFRIPFLNLPINTYGLLVVTGFMVALQIAYLQAKRYGQYEQEAMDFAFWALIGGVLGARVLYIIVEWKDFFVLHPFTQVGSFNIHIPSVFALWKGGLVYWGSIIGGFFAMVLYCKKHQIYLPLFADFAVLGIPLAQAFGRLGCVAAGCCYGKPAWHLDHLGKVAADLPLALRYPPDSLAYPSLFYSAPFEQKQLMLQLHTTLPLFPSQLAEAFGCLILFLLLWVLIPRYKWFHGQIALSYAIGYSIMRFLLEMVRGDRERGYVIQGFLSTSQFISLVIVLVCLCVIFYLKKRNQQSAV